MQYVWLKWILCGLQVAARHTRFVPCQGCNKAGAALYCKCDAAHMCEACHSSNPLAAAHETEPVAPLPSVEQVRTQRS